ncbi:MAG: O-antigen ligase family protein, partial [Candidatus Omnitrophota bacterium]
HVFLFMACVDYFKTEKKVNKILLFCIGAGFFIGLNGIVQYIIGVDMIRDRHIDPLDYLHRISSSFKHSNDFGAYLIIVLSVCCGLFFSKLRPFKQRILLLVLGGVLSYCLIFTQSRGAWLGFIVSLFVLAILKSRKLLVVFLILAVLSPFVLPDFVKQRFSDFTTINQSTGTVWERLKLWQGTAAMIKEHPFLGFGTNTYTKNFPSYKPVDYADVRYTHNSYLQMAAEIGIVGSGVLIVFLILLLITAFKGVSYCPKGNFRDLYIGLIAGMTGFLFHCGVDTHFFSVTLSAFMFFCLGLIYSMRTIVYEKKA